MSTANCSSCGLPLTVEEIPDHWRNVHSQDHGDFERWPDGSIVIYEPDAKPEDVHRDA